MENCIFCKIINHEIPSYTIYEDEQVVAFLDIAQATKGHTLVVVKKHYETILDIPEDELTHLITVVKKLAKEIKEKTGANGINLLQNNFPAAEQSVMHFHFHIIPRYDETDGFNSEFKETNNKDFIKETYELLK